MRAHETREGVGQVALRHSMPPASAARDDRHRRRDPANDGAMTRITDRVNLVLEHVGSLTFYSRFLRERCPKLDVGGEAFGEFLRSGPLPFEADFGETL